VTYELETTNINKCTTKRLDLMQNNAIRMMLKINKNTHISGIKKALKIFYFDRLIFFHNLNFIITSRKIKLLSEIMDNIYLNQREEYYKLKSFKDRIIKLEEFFNLDYHFIKYLI
jgi:hypothetical protein